MDWENGFSLGLFWNQPLDLNLNKVSEKLLESHTESSENYKLFLTVKEEGFSFRKIFFGFLLGRNFSRRA